MTDRPGFDGLEADGGPAARRPDARGRRVRPDDRLGDIRAAVSPTRRRRRSWCAPIAAAAAVAVIVVGAWIALRPSAAPPPIPATPSTTVPVSPVASTPPGASGTARGPAPATVRHLAPAPHRGRRPPGLLPGPPGSPDGRYGLVRVFVPGQLPAGATLAQKADAALAAAVTVPADNPNRFVAAWPAGTTARYVALPAPEVGVSLSGPGVTGLPEEAQRIAVQALVWTVTAAVQQATAPVPVTVASGGPIFETVGTNVFKRPGAERQFEELASIWVDSPYAGQVARRRQRPWSSPARRASSRRTSPGSFGRAVRS